jgi:hypothetical protein
MTTACPNYFEKIEQDIPRGAIAGLETLAASTQAEQMTEEWMAVIDAICEKKFATEWRKSVTEWKSTRGSNVWKFNRIRGAQLDTIYGVIGAQRGDTMKGKQFLELMGQHFVLSPEFANAIQIPDFKQRASKCLPYLFADGAVIRARVLISVDQVISEQPAASTMDHLVTLEMSLTPRIGKKSILASETILEMTEEPMTAGNWKIVDVNFALSDNYPLDPPEESRKNHEEGEEPEKKDEKTE